MALPNPNPFETAKADFRTETKLDADTNLGLYLQYLQYRLTRDSVIHTNALANEVAQVKIGIDKLIANISGLKSAVEKVSR